MSPLTIRTFHDVIFRVGSTWHDNGLYAEGRLIPSSKLNQRVSVPESIGFDDYSAVISEPVFYLGVLYSCWGNCITDNLKFLWPFLQLDKYPFLRDCKIVYSEVRLFGKPIPDNYLKILSMFGISLERLVPIRENTLLRECILAEESYIQDPACDENLYTNEYRGVIDHIRERCNAMIDQGEKLPKKVYFSRSRWHRWEYGERSLEDVFARAGYEIVWPELLSLEKMVAMLSHVKDFASTDGSCAHNSVFLPYGAAAVLIRKIDYKNKYQIAINKARNLDVTMVDANLSIVLYDDNDKLGGPFFVYPSRDLENLLGVKGNFPVGEFIRYLCWSLTLHYGHLVGEAIRGMRKLLGRS